LSATETLRCSAACSARYSCTVSSTALISTIVEMMTKLARSPVSAEITAATSRMITSGLRNRLRNLSGRGRRRRSSRELGPQRSRRSAASAELRPFRPRVWVSNSQSDTVVRFPADDPSKVESFRSGIGVRALALDSKGNVWVSSNTSLDFPPPVIPDAVSITKQFQIARGCCRLRGRKQEDKPLRAE
jgi:hypothetical protein